MNSRDCKLCSGETASITDDQFNIIYHSCRTCGYIFTDDKDHLNPDDEKRHYNSTTIDLCLAVFP